jgi:hypothetical protein
MGAAVVLDQGLRVGVVGAGLVQRAQRKAVLGEDIADLKQGEGDAFFQTSRN